MDSRDTALLNETKIDLVIGYDTDATRAVSWDPDIVMTGSQVTWLEIFDIMTLPGKPRPATGQLVTQRSTFLSILVFYLPKF